MADRDSVETHLMIIKTWASFALEKDINFFEPAHFRDVVRWVGDAIALLKEQESVEPTLIREGRNKYYNDYVCPGCDNELHYGQNYCSECGRSVKWE